MRNALILSLLLGGCQFIPGTDASKVAEARKAVAAQLTDPASAQFRNEQVPLANLVCGEVNAKNQMGGYAGFLRFAYRLSSTEVAFEPDSTAQLCVDNDCCDRKPRQPGLTHADREGKADVYEQAADNALGR